METKSRNFAKSEKKSRPKPKSSKSLSLVVE
jgi:hypothetical protein